MIHDNGAWHQWLVDGPEERIRQAHMTMVTGTSGWLPDTSDMHKNRDYTLIMHNEMNNMKY